MKTHEEIEKLGEKYVLQPKYDDKGHKGSFIQGYTKCQEDMGFNAIYFANWIVKKGYKLNQMNVSNNGGMWFLTEKSIGVNSIELYNQYIKELNEENQ